MRMHSDQNQQAHLLFLATAVERLMRDAQHPLQSEVEALGHHMQKLISVSSSSSIHSAGADACAADNDLKKPVLQRTRSLASSGEKHLGNSVFGSEYAAENYQEVILYLRNQVANQQQHILELRSKVNYLESSLQDTRTELRDTKMDLRNRSCQGNFIWRVKNYQKLRDEAKNGAPNCVIHSPGFYTSFNGYQFCIRLNLNGVENARGTHLSLFIHLMQSDNDDILPWPFTGKVTLSICDQQEVAAKRNPITETLVAKPGLAAFQRPNTLRNHKGFGYMEFAPISYLESDERCFIKDDTLLIKAEVRSNAPS